MQSLRPVIYNWIRLFVYVLCFALLVISSQGCSNTRVVSRMDTDTVTDLSGRWNDTDSRTVAEEMISQCLSGHWSSLHMQKSGGKLPVVIAGAIRNKSTEHIPVGTFLGDIEFALINSGRVTVVASASERGELRLERADQWENASAETVKQIGRELGADYMLTGSINSISDREGGKSTITYQIDLYLTDIESNVKRWAGQDKIKKFISSKHYKP